MKTPTKTGAPSKPVPTGRELDGMRVADASTILTKSLGPFGGSVALICITSFLSVEFSRSDIAAVVIGAIAVTAIAALSLRSLSH
jgi:hypothetical protein